MLNTSAITSRIEARLPGIRRKSRTAPPWIDPSPAGDQTYDPFGTCRPFRPTHRTPGVGRRPRKQTGGTRPSLRPAVTVSPAESFDRLRSAMRNNVSWGLGDRLPAFQQSVLKPLVLLAVALILLAALTSAVYSRLLPQDENAYAPATAPATSQAQPPVASTSSSPVGTTTPMAKPVEDNAGPPLIDPATGDEFRLPVAFSSLTDPRFNPDPTAPSMDIAVPVGTRVYAVHAGTARIIDTNRCGTGVAIAGTDGNTYIYCHASQLDIANSVEVKAGDLIMHSGTVPASTTAGGKREKAAAALHMEIAVNGAAICPQMTLTQWFSGAYASPAGAGSAGCSSGV